ncbi:MAG: hypothetical protein DRH03_00730 [Deltaproteobacteria bacterium]|nr:MAG: hypothetical protein DRH03_00730 [Deltaproteobacteria bacterium]
MPPRRRARRLRVVEKLNLSEHTLDVNIRRCSYDKFRFSEIEDYVLALTGNREYQFQAIKQTMIYLWGGGYPDVTALALENFRKKPHIRERFEGSEEIMIGHLPLADRLSGVVHMATGTGKSYVIFAVAYLSLIMGLTKRVLVLGPSSTIIEEGLRDKFANFINCSEWNSKLPQEYQGKAIDLLTDNDAITDGSITIENINAVYTFGGILDTLFKGTNEVLVLGDEIHHAYSHLKFNSTRNTLVMDQEADAAAGRTSPEKSERLWMQFLRKNPEITRHIGFTGTPYNKDDYFADVIFDYHIRSAIKEQFIKDINPIINVETDAGDMQWTTEKRFTVVLEKHLENRSIYAYKRGGQRTVKPITVFYCPSKNIAKKRTDEFIDFLTKWERQENGAAGSESEIRQLAQEKVICVITGIAESEFKNKLDNIEVTDPDKIGGKVEFIFSVGKLLEGWDVDNVFQIVPMEERIFNSKLLISQVIGRGLRLPRKVVHADIQRTYPMLTVTNHERFADHIRELMDAVTNSDMYITSGPLPIKDEENWRGKHHFTLFNLNYLSETKLENNAPDEATTPDETKNRSLLRELILTKEDSDENVTIERIKGTDKYTLKRKTVPVDSLVAELYRRFKGREYEGIRFDFGNGEQQGCPQEDEIRDTILRAMEKAEIPAKGLTAENKKQILLFFNQFLPQGKKRRVFVNVTGNVVPVSTHSLHRHSIKVGELYRDATAFLSEDYEQEVDEKSKVLLRHMEETQRQSIQNNPKQLRFNFDEPTGLLNSHTEYVRSLVEGDERPPYIVNPSIFKTPQSAVLVSHYPEKEFVFLLLKYAQYFDAWIKSPDRGFYSIDYEYWKSGKDRIRRGFNPDFFIKTDLDNYILTLKKKGQTEHLDSLRDLQDKGYETLIRAVEIKSDDDSDEATPAKVEWAKKHFLTLNEKLLEPLPTTVAEEFQDEAKQFYTFDLLTPNAFNHWFEDVQDGAVG